MQVVQTLEQLFREIFLMRIVKLEGGMVQQPCQIVGDVLKNHIAIVLFDHDLAKLDNVVVVQRLQELDFSNGSNGELKFISTLSARVVRGKLTPSRSPSIRIFLSATWSLV